LGQALRLEAQGLSQTLATDLQGTAVGAFCFCPGPVSSNLGKSTQSNRPEHLKNEGAPAWRAPSPPPGKPPLMDSSLFMTPEEVGERVLRGILRNDLFIFTHPEFKRGVQARNEALIRAFPDDADNVQRREMLSKLRTLVYNPIYEKQTTPPAFKWTAP
jgi:short-subunit dehydrogenase